MQPAAGSVGRPPRAGSETGTGSTLGRRHPCAIAGRGHLLAALVEVAAYDSMVAHY
ncbi:hypothetical protein [Nocardia sp. CA-290969]|uniref:hypothetical protein n=1 Tax=Nocardia sp. CA-290969 TaxID=3239986 RepID=UPI003D9201C3